MYLGDAQTAATIVSAALKFTPAAPLSPIISAASAIFGGFGKGHVMRPKFYADYELTNAGVKFIKAYQNKDASGKNVVTEPGKDFANATLAMIKKYKGNIVKPLTLGFGYQQKYNVFDFTIGVPIKDDDLAEFHVGLESTNKLPWIIPNLFILAVKRGFIVLPDKLMKIIAPYSDAELGGGVISKRHATVEKSGKNAEEKKALWKAHVLKVRENLSKIMQLFDIELSRGLSNAVTQQQNVTANGEENFLEPPYPASSGQTKNTNNMLIGGLAIAALLMLTSK